MARAIESGLAARLRQALAAHSIEAYLASFAKLPAGSHYHAVPVEARQTCAAIEAVGGAEAVEAHHRLVLLHLIARTAAEGPTTPMRTTPEARGLLDDYLARVIEDAIKGRKRAFRHGHEPFAKDFAVCRGRLLPCGVELLDPLGSIPRSLAFKGGTGQALTMARMTWRLGGIKAVWSLHFDRRLLKRFDAQGYVDLYLSLADLLEANPEIRGITSASWWHDPRVVEISPELSFIGAIPENGGAYVMRVGEDDHATADALRFAPARKAMHDAGLYRPCVYMLVWARQDVLAWARSYRAGVATGSGAEQRRMPAA